MKILATKEILMIFKSYLMVGASHAVNKRRAYQEISNDEIISMGKDNVTKIYDSKKTFFR